MSLMAQIKKTSKELAPKLLSHASKLTTFAIARKIIFIGLNKLLTKLPGYTVKIGGVSWSLMNLSVEIQDITVLKKTTRELSEPLLKLPRLSLDLDWSELLHKKIVGDILVDRPQVYLNLRTWKQDESERPDPERRQSKKIPWQVRLQKLMSFEINAIIIKEGIVEVVNYSDQPSDPILIHHVEGRIRHLSNNKVANPQPSSLGLTCGLLEGKLEWHAAGYFLDLKPSFKTDLKIVDVNLTYLQNFFRKSMGVRLARGIAEFYCEAEAKDGLFKGYAKPIFDDLDLQPIARPTFMQRIKGWIVRLSARLLKNKDRNRIATRINFEGDLKDPDVKVLNAVGNFVKNAFGAAFTARLEHRFSDLVRGNAKEREFTYSSKRKSTGLWALVKESFSRWMEHEVPRMAAALSYYTCFSLAPLLLLLIAVVGLAFGKEAAQNQILSQLTSLVGRQSAETIQTMIAAAWQPAKGIFATIISGITLLIGAVAVLNELKTGLNRIMKVSESSNLGTLVKDRARYLGFVLGIGFLLLVSLAISAAVTSLGEALSGVLPAPKVILHAIDLALSLGVITLLFAMMYRFLPSKRLPWKAVWPGSFYTTLLFVAGKFGLGLYLGKESTASSYGAAGSILIVLLWVYYSALILYFGAELTEVNAENKGFVV